MLIRQWRLRCFVKADVVDWCKEWKAGALDFPTESEKKTLK